LENTMSNAMKWLGFGALAIAVAAALFIWSRRPPQPSVSVAMEKIRIGAVSFPQSALIWIAEAEGYFRQVGLDPDVKWHTAGKLAADALEAGESDVVICADFVLVTKSFANTGLRALATVSEADDVRVIGRRDRSVTNAAALKGKRIGVTLGSGGEFFLGRLLAFNNIETRDATLVDLPPQAMVGEITKGALDAAVTWPPAVVEIKERLGENGVMFDAQGGQRYFFLLVSTKEWIDAKPALADRMVKALLLAAQWAAANPDKVRALVSHRTGISEEWLKQVGSNAHLDVGLPQALLVAMEGEARWAVRKGLVQNRPMPDFSEVIDSTPLQRVNPTAVGLFK